MTIVYSHRRYRDGDAQAINALYRRVTGIVRSEGQFAWQWLQAPGGIGEMWLIEAAHPDGPVELIGHHGVMPVRFTDGNRDLLFGKTENTMVLPEYRRKILYPRLEMEFAKAYEPRFHALFSTTGSPEALRQRKASRFVMDNHWIWMEHGSQLLGSATIVASHIPWLGRFLPRLLSSLPSWRGSAGAIHYDVLPPEAAAREAFFDTYWSRARLTAGIAPARFRDDLTWRFWRNPYQRPDTYITDGPHGRGFAIVDLSRPAMAKILDWSFDGPDSGRIAMAALLAQLASSKRAHLITFAGTDDGVGSDLASLFRSPWVARFRQRQPATMPRKVTARGVSEAVSTAGWQVTPIIFEGR